MTFKAHVSSAWQFLFAKNDRTPDMELPVTPVDLSHFKDPGRHQLNSTWLGHSSLRINISGYRILTDPVFKKKSPLLTRPGLTERFPSTPQPFLILIWTGGNPLGLMHAAQSNQIPIATPMADKTVTLDALTQEPIQGSPWWEKALEKSLTW